MLLSELHFRMRSTLLNLVRCAFNNVGNLELEMASGCLCGWSVGCLMLLEFTPLPLIVISVPFDP